MKLPSTPIKTLAVCATAALATLAAHAGTGAEWHNAWMPQASADVVAQAPSGDRLLGDIVAGYTRAALDRGGWENTLMHNAEYVAPIPLLAVGVGSGATSAAPSLNQRFNPVAATGV